MLERFITLLLLSASVVVSRSQSYEYLCPVECNCFISDRISCPNFNIELAYDQRPSSIHCTTSSSSPWTVLSHLNLSLEYVLYDDCPLPKEGSLIHHWPAVKYLYFENQADIGPFKREHFSNSHDVHTLVFVTNSSHEFPNDLFDDATNVRHLEIVTNSMNKNVLRNFPHLEEIHLTIQSSESLDAFSSDTLNNSLNLNSVFVLDNRFRRLTKRFSAGLSKVEFIKFYLNEINDMDSDAFEPLISLKTFSFVGNKIDHFPAALFSSNKRLENVEIRKRKTNLVALPSGFLSHLPNLKKIEIRTGLQSLPANLLEGSHNLEELDLSFNFLTSIPAALFDHQQRLVKIDLSENNLKILPGNLFSELQSLTSLDLSGNHQFDRRNVVANPQVQIKW